MTYKIYQYCCWLLCLTATIGYTQSYWNEDFSTQRANTNTSSPYKYYTLNKEDFAKALHSTASRAYNQYTIITLPDGNGNLEKFNVKPSSVLSPELALRYPDIETYQGYAVDNPEKAVNFTFSPAGLSVIFTEGFHYAFVQPTDKKGLHHKAYARQIAVPPMYFGCHIPAQAVQNALRREQTDSQAHFTQRNNFQSQSVARTIKIAVVATYEYVKYFGGDKRTALAQIVSTVQRASQVYKAQMGIDFQLVSGEEVIFSKKSESDISDLIEKASLSSSRWTGAPIQKILDEKVGNSRYDVGHLFHDTDNPNGNAGCIGCVCDDNNKGKGFSAGNFKAFEDLDRFDVDFFCHELGHQMGATHVFNLSKPYEGYGTQVEPGSGSTIMGYAGITGANDVQPRTDAYFNHLNVKQIVEYIKTQSCPRSENFENKAPQIDSLLSYTIPKGTAYVLRGHATDADNDPLYYSWEQSDNSGAVSVDRFSPNNSSGPMARSLPPNPSPERYIPRLSRILQNQLTERAPNRNSEWETVSNVTRNLNWSLMVMDRKMTARNRRVGDNTLGSTSFANMKIRVISNAGPFEVSSHSQKSYWFYGTTQTITWQVANTNKEPVNTQKVTILFAPNGSVFSITIAAHIPNNGVYTFTVTDTYSATAGRYMITADDNIYLAVNKGIVVVKENGDIDGDGIPDNRDNCVETANSNQQDTDNDGIGDVCDDDLDGDGVPNNRDNCPNTTNPNQIDTDDDGIGDVCDDDLDGDGVPNDRDNCPKKPNPDQNPAICSGDQDQDGILDDDDNCPATPNPDQKDTDSDGIGDVCDDDRDGDGIPNDRDNCPDISNPDQTDTDGDGIGDACDPDADGDGIPNEQDNCPYIPNPTQKDTDKDGFGDACDDDLDGDGIPNNTDNCPEKFNPDQKDTDKDGIGDACDPDLDGDGIPNEYDEEQDTVLIPNAFTPNDDGINDKFFIHRLTAYPENNLKIYTTEGTLIYEAHNYKSQWKGIGSNGQRVPRGYYYYKLTLKKIKEVKEGWLYINY